MPNPYVIEPLRFGARDIAAGDLLSFNVALIGRALGQLPLIVYALQRALSDGLCKRCTQATWIAVEWEDGEMRVPVWDAERSRVLEQQPGLEVPAFADDEAVTLHFHTPLRLQQQGRPLPVKKLSPRALVRTSLRRASLLFERHLDRPGCRMSAVNLAELVAKSVDRKGIKTSPLLYYHPSLSV